MKTITDKYLNTFKSNIDSVYQLMNFDRVVQDFSIEHLESIIAKVANPTSLRLQ